MGRYKSAAKHRRDREAKKGAGKLAIAGIALAALVGAYIYTTSGRRELDHETLCPASPDAVTVLLVDVTDPMNLAQRQDFINQLERLRSTIPQFGKLAIFKVDAMSEQLLKPVIERCNPGTAENVSELTGNKASAAKRWREGFEKPLDEAFSSITAASGATRSPIVESIQSIALTELKNQETSEKPRRLIVVSDLLQNTERLTFYSGLPEPAQLVTSDAFRTLRTDLNGVDIELWMLQRPDAASRQPAKLRQVWEAMIAEMGGRLQREYNVSG